MIDEDDGRTAQVARVASDLRGALTPLLAALAGTPSRPIRLTRELGLDKSLASRLVQACRAEADPEFLHTVPSPTGLRILLERARRGADAKLLERAAHAVDAFDNLIASMPGGRQALDALMGEGSSTIRERREQMARQASFKAQSFLFGHYCETLATALFIVPSADAGRVDVLEVHRRLGLHRLSPSAALPLLSVLPRAPAPAADDDGPCMADLRGDPRASRPEDFIVADASSAPLPTVRVDRDGALTTFVLDPGDDVRLPARLTTAFRVLRADTVEQTAAYNVVRNYMLHTPCRTLVRDVFVARGLWPDATPQVGFYLPGPSGTPMVAIEPGKPHLRRVNLTARIEQLPDGEAGFDLAGVEDQRPAIAGTLGAAGLDPAAFRGWRCRMAYPVPLIEMQVAMRFSGRGS